MSCASSAAFSRVASFRPTCKRTLTSSLRGLPVKILSPCKINSQNIELHIVKAAENYLVKKVSGAELHKLLDADRDKSMVVDFYAAWCGPCVILAQELERLAVEFGHKVKFVKVDTDDEYDLAHKLQVRGLPTVMFVSKDPQKSVIRTEGILPNEVYRSIIQNDLLCGEKTLYSLDTVLR